MKRKLLLAFAALLLLAAYSPSAYAAGGLPSRERGDGETVIDEDAVPLIEFPTAEITAAAAADENGSAAVALEADQILEAVESVVRGDAVRITVTVTAEAEKVSAALPREALKAVAERTGAELEIVSGVGSLTLPNQAVASIVEKAGGEDVTFQMARQGAEFGKELLEKVQGAGADVAEDRIRNGSVTEISILSGGRHITSWDGSAAALRLTAGSGGFEPDKGYQVIQVSGDMSRTEHTGRCVMGGGGLCVEISITHLSVFLTLADAVEEVVDGGSIPMVVSPLAARTDGGGMTRLWLAAGLAVIAGALAGAALKRRRKF